MTVCKILGYRRKISKSKTLLYTKYTISACGFNITARFYVSRADLTKTVKVGNVHEYYVTRSRTRNIDFSVIALTRYISLYLDFAYPSARWYSWNFTDVCRRVRGTICGNEIRGYKRLTDSFTLREYRTWSRICSPGDPRIRLAIFFSGDFQQEFWLNNKPVCSPVQWRQTDVTMSWVFISDVLSILSHQDILYAR